MAKVTRQRSGVVSGSADESRRTTVDVASEGLAGVALSNRKLAGLRGKKAAARATAAKRTVAKRTVVKTTTTTKRRR